jgi:hypothetical protein
MDNTVLSSGQRGSIRVARAVVEIDAFPASEVNRLTVGLPTAALARHSRDTRTHLTTFVFFNKTPLSPC